MKILNFFIKTHLHLSLANALLIHSIQVIFFDEFVWALPFFLFGITGFVYSLNSLKDKDEDEVNSPERYKLFKKYGKIIISIYLAISLISIFSFLSSPKTLIVIGAAFMTGFVYSIPLLPWYTNGSLTFYKFKEILLFKNLVTALSHVLYAVFLPFIYFEIPPELPVWMIGWTFFSVTMVSAIMCDVRDVDGDKAVGIKTLATQLGKRKTTNLCYAIILIPLSISLIMGGIGLISIEYLVVILLINMIQLGFLIYQDFLKLNKDFYGFASESFIYVAAISFLII